jgi:hypothetical protein
MPGAENHTPTDVADGIDRRSFITAATAAGVGAFALLDALGDDALAALLDDPQAHAGRAIKRITTPQVTLQWDLRRRADQLSVRFDLYNLVLVGSGANARLVRKSSRRAAYVVVVFPPQAVSERAYVEAFTSEPTPVPGTTASRLAGGSRLAFSVPSTVRAIPFQLDHLLDWSALTPNLVPVASYTLPRRLPRGAKLPVIRKPQPWETSLELPYRLALSPTTAGRWRHEQQAITHGSWTELWRTRHVHLAGGAAVEGGTLRAVWSYDPGIDMMKKPGGATDGADPPYLQGLLAHDRHRIVRATADFHLKGRADVTDDRLWLTGLGGFLTARGAWDINGNSVNGIDIAEWKHRSTMGRDHYVKVVDKGHLFPFGHRAVKVSVTERRFEKVGPRIVAVLRKRQFLVVREPVKRYVPGTSVPGLPDAGRGLPFTSLRVATLVTPNIDPATKLDPTVPTIDAFAPKVGGVPFRFHLVGTDWSGREVEFTAPAWFVSTSRAYLPSMTKIRDLYNALPVGDDQRIGAFEGAAVALAPPDKAGDTDVTMRTITFEAAAPVGATTTAVFDSRQQPRVYPRLKQAEARLAAAEQASGGVPLLPVPVLAYDPVYLTDGFGGANKGHLFANMLAGSAPKLEFGGGSSGGVITPNMNVGGLSRLLGPVGGTVDSARNGDFKPEDFFKGIEAKILGGVNLVDLLVKTVSFSGGGTALDKAMKITYETQGTKLVTRLHWVPEVSDSNPIISKGAKFAFTLDANATVDLLDPAGADFDVKGDLEDFSVHLVPGAEFIQIDLNQLVFQAKRGQKSKVDVDIEKVTFKGPLAFVEKLQSLMDFSGDGGPKITVTPTGINAAMHVPLPDLQVGIFGLSNMFIDAGFSLPFTGKPARFRFGFASREDKFHLQVSFLAGGGFFAIAIGTDGVEQIEAAFEFGAMLSLDVGVASGEVHIMAGIYFSYAQDEAKVETCILTGYIRMGGSLDILGIISMSIEFYMGLTYEIKDGHKKVYGDATVTAEIHVLFFSASVEMHAHRQFGGQDGDPTFAQQFSAPDWSLYCDAFAA